MLAEQPCSEKGDRVKPGRLGSLVYWQREAWAAFFGNPHLSRGRENLCPIFRKMPPLGTASNTSVKEPKLDQSMGPQGRAAET